MSDETTNAKKRPDYIAWFAPERDAPWTRIGAAWAHDDGQGLSLKLDLLPNAPGGIVLRKPKAEASEGAA